MHQIKFKLLLCIAKSIFRTLEYGHIVGHQIQDFGSSMNQFRPSNNIAVGGLSNRKH